MSTQPTNPMDPMAFLKTLWGSAGMPLPGLVTPTLDTDELEKRITDLKAVEGWLKTNLGILQMTIQGLEVQRATLTTLQAMGKSISSADITNPADINPALNPFTNPNLSSLWPWNLMQTSGVKEVSAAEKNQPVTTDTPPKKEAASKNKRG